MTDLSVTNYKAYPSFMVTVPSTLLNVIANSDPIDPKTGLISISSYPVYNKAIDQSSARYSTQWFRLVNSYFSFSTVEFEMVSKFNDSSVRNSKGGVELNCPIAAEVVGFCKKVSQAELWFTNPFNEFTNVQKVIIQQNGNAVQVVL